jgi:hypothetical protein
MVAKKIMMVLGILLIAISCSMAVPVFTSPTPSNNTPYGDYQLILNISDDSAMDYCNFEIDGVNQSGTLSDDFLSCWYEMPQVAKYVGHNYSVIGYDSVSSVEYATDFRNIAYYGCGYINETLTTLKTNVSFNGSWVACFIWTGNSMTLDGAGYLVDGGSADWNVVMLADYTDGTTVKNLKVRNFATGLACGDSCSNVLYENNTLTNITLNALYMGATAGGIVRNNYVNGFHDTGISFGNTYDYNIQVYGNTVIGDNEELYYGDTEYGIYVGASGNTIDIHNNNISNVLTTGIYLTATAPSNLFDVNVYNNRIIGVPYGITTILIENITITNNRIINSSSLGLYLANHFDTLSNNQYINNTVAIDFDCANFDNQYIVATDEIIDGTRFYLSDIQAYLEAYQLSPTTLYNIPVGKANYNNVKLKYEALSGVPVIDYMRFYWNSGNSENLNESSITLENYNTGVWTMLADQPNIALNVIELWNISMYGDMALLSSIAQATSLEFSSITIDKLESGLTNQVKLHIYAEVNDSTIAYCDIRTNNYVEEDRYYWSANPYSPILNRTIVIEKTEDNRVRLYCASITGDTAYSNYVSIKSSQAIPDWLVWACLVGSVILLIYAIKSENLFYGIFASLGLLVFVKLSEGAFLSEVESLVPVFFWIKVVYGVCLTLLMAQHFLKQAKSEIS